jgi:NAD-dependent dihydropyrimidine dehydrogenase PreA subunit
MPQVTIDPLRCEGARKCAQVCPVAVFALRPPDPALPFLARLKVSFHGGRQAFVANETACTACMLCVGVCPEAAITIRP